MAIIQLGSESEYIRITLRSPYNTEGWCRAKVDIALPCFSGHIEPWLEAGDIERFAAELQQVHELLKGEAKLLPREEQFTLHVQAGIGGHITICGVAWSGATYGDKLQFSLELDQSYLRTTLSQLASAASPK
ncbi:hypothetical protein [Rhizobacter sp. SG703]|uniref:WapI family immunity protein n=1 Tax=Rhizobacter sp. SG703 TaxID=2587140 RepID=UPI0014482FC2|nr:hypothetical protein [Rhizobacter sp. SG703]NKI97838.1 hypothetical protein [Rhizobacter sp. SG703]